MRCWGRVVSVAMLSDEKREEIRALLATGQSCRAIARKAGVSDQTVRRIRDEQPEGELEQIHLDRKKQFAEKAWDSIDKALTFANQRLETASVAAEKFEPLLDRLIDLLTDTDDINGRDIRDILMAFAPLLNIPLKDVSVFIGTMYDKRALAEGEPTGHQKVSGQVDTTVKKKYEDLETGELEKALAGKLETLRALGITLPVGSTPPGE